MFLSIKILSSASILLLCTGAGLVSPGADMPGDDAAFTGESREPAALREARAKAIFVNGRIGMGSPRGGRAYWEKDSTFVEASLKALHCEDIPPYFTDVQHAVFSSARQRERAGYAFASEHLEEVTAGADTLEKFRFVTHSMGAAFAEGMARRMAESGCKTDVIVHFEPYQARDIHSAGESPDILAIDFQMADDFLLRLGSGGHVQGADLVISGGKSDAPLKKKHRYPVNHSSTWALLSGHIDDFLE